MAPFNLMFYVNMKTKSFLPIVTHNAPAPNLACLLNCSPPPQNVARDSCVWSLDDMTSRGKYCIARLLATLTTRQTE